MKTILLDIDGVIIDYIGPLMRSVAWHKPRMPTVWDLSDMGVPEISIQYHTSRQGFCRDLPLYPWARTFLNNLRQYYRVVACTSPYDRSLYWASERWQYLRQIGFSKRDIVLTGDKSQIIGDLLIDDNPENCRDFEVTGRPAILLEQPYNLTVPHKVGARDLQHIWHMLRPPSYILSDTYTMARNLQYP